MGNEIATQKPQQSWPVAEYMPFGATDPALLVKLEVNWVREILCVPTKSGKLCSNAQAYKFMMLCKAKGLNPFEGDAYLLGYDTVNGPQFSQITAHQAFLKRAELHPEYNGMKSGVFVMDRHTKDYIEREGDFTFDDDVLVGGWACVYFKSRAVPMYKRLKLTTFAQTYGRWKVDPAGMIVKCFDEETEVLTTNGFEKFVDATGKILEVGMLGLTPTEAVPFVQRYAGPMVSLLSDDLNFSVTPNHDMVTTAGKVEAGVMLENSVGRTPRYFVPRCVRQCRPDFPLGDAEVRLAAAYLADGHDKPHRSFWISVSKPRKIAALESLGRHTSRHVQHCAGAMTKSGGRVITTKSDKHVFGFPYTAIEPLVARGKRVQMPGLLALSQRQAKLFVDTLIEFDGSTNKKTGVRRFYASNMDVLRAFEVAAVSAGYSVSNRKQRKSDKGGTNYIVTISERCEIGVRRLETVGNASGRVWCVTVPSGVIVVRRAGFSMLCGNCAEADALRSSFPTMFGGLHIGAELGLPESHDQAREQPDYAPQARLIQKGAGPRRSAANDKLAAEKQAAAEKGALASERRRQEREEAAGTGEGAPEPQEPEVPQDEDAPPPESAPEPVSTADPQAQETPPWVHRLVKDIPRDEMGAIAQDAIINGGIATWGELVDLLNYQTVKGKTSSQLLSPAEVRKAKSAFVKAFKAAGFTGEVLQ